MAQITTQASCFICKNLPCICKEVREPQKDVQSASNALLSAIRSFEKRWGKAWGQVRLYGDGSGYVVTDDGFKEGFDTLDGMFEILSR